MAVWISFSIFAPDIQAGGPRHGGATGLVGQACPGAGPAGAIAVAVAWLWARLLLPRIRLLDITSYN